MNRLTALVCVFLQSWEVCAVAEGGGSVFQRWRLLIASFCPIYIFNYSLYIKNLYFVVCILCVAFFLKLEVFPTALLSSSSFPVQEKLDMYYNSKAKVKKSSGAFSPTSGFWSWPKIMQITDYFLQDNWLLLLPLNHSCRIVHAIYLTTST